MNKSKSLDNLSFNYTFNRKYLIKESNNNIYNKKGLSLFKDKLFLEKILYIVKYAQLDYLSFLSDNHLTEKTNNNKIKVIKNILNNLKNDLTVLLKNKNDKMNNIQKIITEKKTALVNTIFGINNQNINKSKGKNENKYSRNNYNNRNNINNNINNINKYNKELSNLKLLNFKIENQLEFMDIELILKSQNIKDFKNIGTQIDDDYLEIFCENKNDISEVSDLLHEDLKDIRQIFKMVTKKKTNQNKNIKMLESEIKLMKENFENKYIKHNDYIYSNEIINEESKEDYTQTNQLTTINTLENKKKSKDYEKCRNFIFNSIKKINLEQIKEISKHNINNNNNKNVININNIININMN